MKFKPSPFAWVSFAMIVGVMGTALISPLYALYKEAWQLQASDISMIYTVYMGGALCSLLFLGRLPDRAGFKTVMQAGLVLTLIGTLISMLAWNMSSLIVGRFIVGVASSMMTTSATMGMTALSRPGHVQRVAMMIGFLMAFGFGLGPLVGGVMGQWAPWPLVTTYIPTLILGALGLVRQLGKALLPYHVNAFTLMAAKTVYENKELYKERIKTIREERDKFADCLKALGFKVWPTATNFVTFRAEGELMQQLAKAYAAKFSERLPEQAAGGKLIFKYLLANSILVRDFSTHPVLQGCLRITIGLPEENKQIIAKITELCAEVRA
jgi:MFS family permease